MVRYLSIVFLLLPQVVFAQKVHLGLMVPFAIKKNLITNRGSKYALMSSYGASAILQIDGTDEKSLTFQQHVGIWIDRTAYSLKQGNEKIGIATTSLLIQSTLLIPSKYENISFNIGIGVLAKLFNGHFTSGTSASQSSNLNQSDSIISRNSRGVIPFISAGICYRYNKHISGNLFISQTMRNYFEQNTIIEYNARNAVERFDLSYQPTFFGVQIAYLF